MEVIKTYACRLALRMWTQNSAANLERFEMNYDVPPKKVLLAKDLRTISKDKHCITKAKEIL
jgi:hypothetical protein